MNKILSLCKVCCVVYQLQSIITWFGKKVRKCEVVMSECIETYIVLTLTSIEQNSEHIFYKKFLKSMHGRE